MPNAPQFPYQDGDVTVLGPEVFASKDDTVISWRGENYTRQEAHKLEVRLCTGPLDATEVGTQIDQTLRRARRQGPGGGA